MKAKDIEVIELGKHCFGQIFTVNDKDYNDYTKEEIIEFIIDMFNNDINSSIFLKETFESGLRYLQYDCVEDDSSTCDQCGDYNEYSKFVKNEI
ncbi:MAG: hypothetical protein ACYC6J_09440 [Coriobacteriia bacterium]